MFRLLSWAAVALAVGLTHGAAAAGPSGACDVPADLVAPTHPLAALGRVLHPGGRLDVLALGSGTLLGRRGGVEGSVPEHMVDALRAAVPGMTVRLTLQGARAETAATMLAVMHSELAQHAYQLVLWQTGTVEAVRKLPPEQFRQTLTDGTDTALKAGADLVLIDVPYSRLLVNHSDLQPYRDVIQGIAAHVDVTLFRRYDLMRHWVEAGTIDMEAAGRGERDRTADRLRSCLGLALARLILAARPPQTAR